MWECAIKGKMCLIYDNLEKDINKWRDSGRWDKIIQCWN